MATGGYWSLIAHAFQEYPFSQEPEEFLLKFGRLRPDVRNLYAAHYCQAEVCNGGFHQFFSNPTGMLAPEAREAFQAMGLTEWARLLEEAMAFFPDPYPRVHQDRKDYLLESIEREPGSTRDEWDPFRRLDVAFYRWLHAEPDRWGRAADAYASQVQAEHGP